MRSFVFVYDRQSGHLDVESFDPGHRVEAFKRRLQLEKQVGAGVEVVVFHADSIEDIQRTHGRYFFSTDEMVKGSRLQDSDVA